MAGAPVWKVYDADGKYQAACKEKEAAAALVVFYGNGSTIRYAHGLIVWKEGSEGQPASESYDYVAETILTQMALGRAARVRQGAIS